MNILDLKKLISSSKAESDLSELEKICQYVGDNAANGYLQSCIDSFNYDDYGIFEFHSLNQSGTLTTDSVGALLEGSIVIKQRQVDPINGIDDSHIISWDKDGSKYTSVFFETPEVTDYAYNRIKASYSDYLDINAFSVLTSLSIPPDMIKDIHHQDVGTMEVTAATLADFDDDVEVLDVVVK